MLLNVQFKADMIPFGIILALCCLFGYFLFDAFSAYHEGKLLKDPSKRNKVYLLIYSYGVKNQMDKKE